MRLLLALLAATVAVGCSSTEAEQTDKGDTASLIVGGTTANIEAWPGMAQLEGIGCGATLISPEWVVTAAHCFDATKTNGGFTQVALGRQNSNAGGGELLRVATAFRHQQYNDQTTVNDIALVKLAQKTTRQPAKVMTPAQWTSLGKAGAQVTVVGWGATQEGGGLTPSLRQVTVPLIDSAQCAGMELGGGTLTDGMICAGLPQGGKDACQGDSGGPLFLTVAGAPVQVGVVSFGAGCAKPNAPGVYTKIAGYYDWINQNTGNALGAAVVTPEAPPPPGDSTTTTPDGTPDDVITGEEEEDTSVGDADEESSDDDDDTDTETKPKPKAKKKKKATPQQYQGCAMGSQTSSNSGAMSALLVLGAALMMRRRTKRASGRAA